MHGKGYYLPLQTNCSSSLELIPEVSGCSEIVSLPIVAENDVWTVMLPKGFCWDDGTIEARELSDGCMLKMKSDATEIGMVAAKYDRQHTAMSKYIWPRGEMTIGKHPNSDICYNLNMVSREHATLYKDGSTITYRDHSANGSWINGRQIQGETVNLQPGDRIDVAPFLQIMVFDQFLAINRPEHLMVHRGLIPFEFKRQSGQPPEDAPVTIDYHRAPRQIQQPNTEPLPIDPPLEKERSKRQPAWLQIGPSTTMIMPMLVSTLVMSRSMGASLVMIGTSSAMSVMWAILNRRYAKQEGMISEENRQRICKQYYAEMEEMLLAETDRERKRLNLNYLSVTECVNLPFASGHRMWERLPNQEDFLKIRLGLGERKLPRDIQISKLKINLMDDALRHEPQRLMDTYQMMQDVPIVVDVKDHRIVGVLGNENSPWMLQSIVTQLAASHSYHDVRIAILYDEANMSEWRFAHRLPHVYAADDRTLRMAVCGELATQEVMNFLDNVLSIRADALQDDQKKSGAEEGGITAAQIPWYVLVVTSPSLMEGQPLMRHINTPGLGFTVIMQAAEMEVLPKECDLIIEARSHLGTVYRADGTMTGVQLETVNDSQLMDFARGIAPYRIKEMVGDTAIPSLVTFLETYGVRSVEELDVARMWNENHAWQNVKSTLGLKAGGVPFILDISDKSHGPHGLIAGTTGAGKSVLLQTFILSLSINYSPEEVQFILIDYKGGGTSEDFRNLPHAAGVIDSLQGERAIFRALASIQGEIKRREAIFKDVGVNNIDDYMKLFNSDPKEATLAHLIIVVDEFAELKKEQPQFMAELVSAARVGRSLGMHLVLATQKPSNSVSAEIDANTRFRICLRVASKSDSNDMLKRPEAAYLKGMGRCYVQVGNDEVFEQVQTAWTGSPYKPEALRPEEEPRMLNEAGQPIKFRRKKKSDGGKLTKEKTELDAVMEAISSTCERYHVPAAHKMWLPEMPGDMLLEELPFFPERSWRGVAWPEAEGRGIVALYGMGDDVDRQRRVPVTIDFQQDHNMMICGLSQSGKTTALQTIAVSLALRYSPREVNLYVFSLTSRTLQSLSALPHVGEVVFDDEEDEQLRLMDLIYAEVERRKQLFHTMATDNYIQYNRAVKSVEGKEPVPAIVVLVDRMQQVRDWGEKKHEDKLNMFYEVLKSASSQGVYIVMTAFNRSELPGKYHPFINAVTLMQNERSDYMDALNERIPPEWSGIREYPGRGVMVVENKEEKAKYIHEMQVAVYHTLESDKQRSDAIAALGAEMQKGWGGEKVRGLMRIPKKPTLSMLLDRQEAQASMKEMNKLPIAYVKQNGTVMTLNLYHNYSGLILGARRSGKTNLLMNMAWTLHQKGEDVYVIGGEKLVNWGKQLSMQCFDYGAEEWKDCWTSIFEETKARSDKLVSAKKVSNTVYRETSDSFKPINILIDDLDRYMAENKATPKVVDQLAFFVDNDKVSNYQIHVYASLSHQGYQSNKLEKLVAAMVNARRGIMLQGMLDTCDPMNAGANMLYQQKKMVYPVGEALMVMDDAPVHVVLPLHEAN